MSVHSVHSVHVAAAPGGEPLPPPAGVAPVRGAPEGRDTLGCFGGSESNCFSELCTKVSTVFITMIEKARELLNQVLTYVGWASRSERDDVPPPVDERGTLAGLLALLPAAATPYAKLLVVKNMYTAEAPEEEKVQVLTEAIQALPDCARRLIFHKHWERYHTEADWTDAPNAGELNFLASIASERAFETFTEALGSIPAHILVVAREYVEEGSEAERLAQISRLQALEPFTEAWMLELDGTTRADLDAGIRTLVRALAADGIIEGVSFAEDQDVVDAAHRAVIEDRIAALVPLADDDASTAVTSHASVV